MGRRPSGWTEQARLFTMCVAQAIAGPDKLPRTPWLPCCAGLMTLQELQLIKDTVLDADMVKNEAEREARMAARRQSALVSKQVDRAENAQKHEAQKPTREVQHKPRASIMHAAGTGNVQNVLPAKELLDWINRGESFLPPALAGRVLAKEGKLRYGTAHAVTSSMVGCGQLYAA